MGGEGRGAEGFVELIHHLDAAQKNFLGSLSWGRELDQVAEPSHHKDDSECSAVRQWTDCVVHKLFAGKGG